MQKVFLACSQTCRFLPLSVNFLYTIENILDILLAFGIIM